MKPTQLFIFFLHAGRVFIAMKLLPLFAFLVTPSGLTEAQTIHPCTTCLPEGITIVRQSQIDSFHLIYPQCTQILGAVKIGGAKIKKLNGLTGVLTIDGDLEVKSTTLLETLSGLDSLISIGGNLSLIGNSALKNVRGLDRLTLLGGSLFLEQNQIFTEMDSFDQLAVVGNKIQILNNSALPEIKTFNNIVSLNSISIGGNARLDRITGFASLSYVGNLLQISNNVILRHLSGFNNVVYAAGVEISKNPLITEITCFTKLQQIGWLRLTISNNARLSRITGFPNLEKIGSSFYLENNPELESLMGFQKLDTIWNTFKVYSNDKLTSLEDFGRRRLVINFLRIEANDQLVSLRGIDQLDPAALCGLMVDSNASLSDCALASICKYLEFSNCGKYFKNNAPGCNSKAEVDSACTHLSSGFREMDPEISIFPNPADNRVVIQCNARGKLTIFNLNGLEMFSTSVRSSQVSIDVSFLPAGFYVLRCVSNNAVRFRNFIKK